MSRLALCDVSGLFTDFLQKLSGEEGDQWLEAFKKMLRKENPWSKLDEVWRTIKRDLVLDSPKTFLSALAEKNRNVNDWAKDIIGKPAFVESLKELEQEYDLFVLTIAQLTGKKDTTSTTDEIFASVKRLGFQKCPAWVGLQLRLDYENQPNGECLFVAMKPIRALDGCLAVFRVRRDASGLWLRAVCAYPGFAWSPGHRWVVCRPRK
ncbi:MAG: hypothetical protein Q8N58_02740 [bacterium]|nr:hypothetical protein [bacterium]